MWSFDDDWAACCDACIRFHADWHFAPSTDGSYLMQPTLHPVTEREHKLIFTAAQTNFGPFASISSRILPCAATTHLHIHAVAADANAGSSNSYRSSNNTRKLNGDCRFSQPWAWTRHLVGCDTVQFRQTRFVGTTLPAQHREGVRFSTRYVNVYRAKQANIPKGGNTQQKMHTFTNRSTRFVSWDTVAVLVNTAQNINALRTKNNPKHN